MPPDDHALRTAVALVLTMAATALAVAADPVADGSAPTTRLSREELVRKWDLNSDGKIDKSEAEVASSRMRRERAEMRLNTGIDPVTGRPRGEPPPPEPPDLDEIFGADTEPADADDADEAERDRPALPGTRAPRMQAPRTQAPRSSRPSLASPSTGEDREPAPRPNAFRQPITGGVRGGGVPARPGFGARKPATPLNAGRPIESLRDGTGMLPGPQSATVRGGLLPRPRPMTPRPSRETFDPY